MLLDDFNDRLRERAPAVHENTKKKIKTRLKFGFFVIFDGDVVKRWEWGFSRGG